MIKRIVAVLAVAILSSACTSSNNKSDSTTTTSDRVTTSTTSRVDILPNRTRSYCDNMTAEIGKLFTDYAEAISTASDSEADLAVQVGRKLVTVGRAWVDQCGHYYPASQVREIEDNLDKLEDALDEYDRTYN